MSAGAAQRWPGKEAAREMQEGSGFGPTGPAFA